MLANIKNALMIFTISIMIYGCATPNVATLHIFENEKRAIVRHMVYPLCLGDRVNDLVTPTREFAIGSYELPVYITRWDTHIGNSAYEGYFSLPLNLVAPRHYIFQTDFSKINKDRVMVWVADMETGEVVSDRAIVELRPPLPAREFNLRRICEKVDDKS